MGGVLDRVRCVSSWFVKRGWERWGLGHTQLGRRRCSLWFEACGNDCTYAATMRRGVRIWDQECGEWLGGSDGEEIDRGSGSTQKRHTYIS